MVEINNSYNKQEILEAKAKYLVANELELRGGDILHLDIDSLRVFVERNEYRQKDLKKSLRLLKKIKYINDWSYNDGYIWADFSIKQLKRLAQYADSPEHVIQQSLDAIKK
tara:strand:+ start:2353 stop:2685 length:333 start_codon:yes stop_codon:yes gene_type:complete